MDAVIRVPDNNSLGVCIVWAGKLYGLFPIGVISMPFRAISKSPRWRVSSMLSHTFWKYCTFTPNSLAMASTSSTSKPMRREGFLDHEIRTGAPPLCIESPG